MVAKISNTGFVFKSVLVGASLLVLGAAAHAASPSVIAPAGAPAAVPAPAAVEKIDAGKAEKPATDKTAKIGEQHRFSAAADAAYEKIKAATFAGKEAAVKDGKALLAAVDEEIAAAKKKAEGATVEAREAAGKQAAHLKAARDKLAAQLEALSAAKAETWDAARKGVESAWRDLVAGSAAPTVKPKA